jgi:hypothetical protein
MNRRIFFRALSALAALPLVPRFLKAQPILPTAAAHPWDIEKYDEVYRTHMSMFWQSIDGPEMMNWGGDVGTKPTWIFTTTRDDVRETHYYAEGWGFVHLKGERRVNGVYVVDWMFTENTRKWETIEA